MRQANRPLLYNCYIDGSAGSLYAYDQCPDHAATARRSKHKHSMDDQRSLLIPQIDSLNLAKQSKKETTSSGD